MVKIVHLVEEEEVGEAKEEETRQQIQELGQQKTANEKRGWTKLVTEMEEQTRILKKKKTPQAAAAAAKDMKIVYSDRHNILNRHQAIMKQLEEKQGEWAQYKKQRAEKEVEQLEDEEERHKSRIAAMKSHTRR